MSDVFAFTYGVELLCASTPDISKSALLAALTRYCPGVELLAKERESNLLAFVHPRHIVELADGRIPAQTLVAIADKPLEMKPLESALQQAWDFSDAEAVVSECRVSVIVTDLMSSSLEYRERVDLFQRALRAVLSCVPCQAIRWQASDRIIAPRAWMERVDSGRPSEVFLSGAANVRMFKIANPDRAPGEFVMDTLGLGALGLPDLQCHFTGLEPSEVARCLYNVAWYVFSEGDVIEDGHTIEGATPGSMWRCQHEQSMIGPDRVVLDLDPGAPHAAGKRS